MSFIDGLSGMGPVVNHQTGEEKTLKDIPFRYLGLYFTATWCSYCWKIKDKIPILLNVVNKKGPLFKLLTFRLDDDGGNFGYYDLGYKVFDSDRASAIATMVGVNGIPRILVYDIMGRLVSSDGFKDMSSFKENTIEMWDRKMNSK